MHFTILSYALSLAALASAQTPGFAWITNLHPAPAMEVFVGITYNLTWTSSVHIGEPMSLHLLNGPTANNLTDLGVVACKHFHVTNDSR